MYTKEYAISHPRGSDIYSGICEEKDDSFIKEISQSSEKVSK